MGHSVRDLLPRQITQEVHKIQLKPFNPRINMACLSADELNQQLQVLTLDVLERYKDIGTQGVDKVSQEFLDLRLPIQSEILDVSADSGLLSARIQTKGYSFIDALDEDPNTISNLRALRLPELHLRACPWPKLDRPC